MCKSNRNWRAFVPTAVAASVLVGAMAVLVTWGGYFAKPAMAQSVDLDQIFWCDESIGPMGSQSVEECLQSRQVLLGSCTSCHTFAPIVLRQRSRDEWEAFLGAHRQRVLDISDADFEQLKDFIGTRFTPDFPEPDLPQVLRDYALPEA